jgi:NADPH-dependent curcumin reductase CurA
MPKRNAILDESQHGRKVVLRRRPGRLVGQGDTELVTVATPEPAHGEALVRTHLIAMDAVTRVIINDDIGIVPPIEIGAPLRSFGAGIVTSSRAPEFPVGAKITGFFEWADWQLVTPDPRTQVLPEQASLAAGLNVHGHTAMAAYFGLLDVGRPQPGNTVVVSGAGGAVGSVAGQLARIRGARVIGIAGGEAKRRWLVDELKFDSAVDYTSPSWTQQLKEEAPGGIDLFFDNVGGEILEAVLPLVASEGRVVSCGASAQYTSAQPISPPTHEADVPIRRFNAMDYVSRFDEAAARMLKWQHESGLVFPQTNIDGLGHAPDALNMLFDGRGRGRVVVNALT